jgi:leucyl aminopeptidase
VSARFIEINEANNVVLEPEELYLIETAPGKTQWVTEEDKWEMRRVSLINTVQITHRTVY